MIRAKKLLGDPKMKFFDENGKNVCLSNHYLTQNTVTVIRDLIEDS